MQKIQKFTDLKTWEEAHKLVLLIYKITDKFPDKERYALTSQMRRAAVSVSSNIAEGFGRRGKKEKIQFYSIGQGSLTELQNQLIVAKDVGYLKESEFRGIELHAILVHKLMTGLIKSINKR